MSLLDRLKVNDMFTPTEDTIAKFILSNPEKAQTLSLQQLADCAFVSKPTAIRFCRKLGYKTYHDFKFALQVDLRNYKENSPIDANFPFAEKATNMQIAETMGRVAKSVVDGCIGALDEFNLKTIVDTLYNSKRIFIFGIGNCYIVAQILINRLSRLNRNAIMLNANSYPFAYLNNLNRDDVVLILSSTGKTLQIERKTIKIITSSKAKTILITSDADLNLRSKFNYILQSYNGEDPLLKNETFASQTSILLLINILFACLFELDYEKNTKTNHSIQKLIKDNYM